MRSDRNIWHPDASLEARAARLRREREQRCVDGYHEDPDNSGLCIHCGVVLDEVEPPE